MNSKIILPALNFSSAVKCSGNPSIPSILRLNIEKLIPLYENEKNGFYYSEGITFIYDGLAIPDVMVYSAPNNKKTTYSICDNKYRPYYKEIQFVGEQFSGWLNHDFSLVPEILNDKILIEEF